MKVILLLSIIFCYLSSTHAQPGGIGTNLYLWLKADEGVSITGSNVSAWDNQALGITMTSQASRTASTAVTRVDNVIGYHPSIQFDGSNNGKLLGSFQTTPTNPMTTFIVCRKNISNNNECCTSPFTLRPAGAMGLTFYNTSNAYTIDGSGFTCSPTTNLQEKNVIVLCEYQSRTNSNGAFTETNGIISTTCGSGTVFANNNTFEVGGRTDGGYNSRIFLGDISEVVYYNSSTLTSLEKQRIQSYLALKYGIVYHQNYLNSLGNTVYDASSYDNNIIGISRDDVNDLDQRQNKDNDDSLRIYLGTLQSNNQMNSTSFATNNQFVILGHDNATIYAQNSTEFPTGQGIDARVEREWKVTNTGFTGTFSLDIKTMATAVDPNDLRLLIDSDSDLSDGTLINPTFSFSAGVITVSGISTTHIPQDATTYFTIVSMDNGTVLPVQFADFQVNKVDRTSVLNWQTYSEINSDYFEIQRSQDLMVWKTIGTQKASGNTNQLSTYEYIDFSPKQNENYYRLKQFDYDGSYSYSIVKNINFDSNMSGLYLYPNPSIKFLIFHHAEFSGEWKIYDISGRDCTSKVETMQEFETGLKIDLNNLHSGQYIIECNATRKVFYKN